MISFSIVRDISSILDLVFDNVSSSASSVCFPYSEHLFLYVTDT